MTTINRRTAIAGTAAVSLAAALPPVSIAQAADFYAAGRARLVALLEGKPGDKLLAAWDRLRAAELAYDCEAENPDPEAVAEHSAAADAFFGRINQTNLSLGYILGGRGEPFTSGDEQTLAFVLNIQACPDHERGAVMAALSVLMERMTQHPPATRAELDYVFADALAQSGIPRLMAHAETLRAH